MEGITMLKKLVSFVLAFVLVVVLCTPGLASNGVKQISAAYGISIYLNGEKQSLLDGAGNPVAPFTYNGTTYVPIRAVSDFFGADVVYDPESNGAYIYDNYAETYAVANRMNVAISDCYLLVNVELSNVLAGELADTSGFYSDCVKKVDNIYSTLELLSKDNFAVGEIIENMLPKFTDFVIAFVGAHNKYESLRTYETSYNMVAFADQCDVAIDQYYAARNAINTYFEQYCWRDLDQ